MDFSGPYATLERLAAQIKSLLSEAGNVQREKHIDSGILSMLERTPRWTVRGSSGQVVEFEVIKEKNEAVKRVLPEKVKEVFVVMSTKRVGRDVVEDVQVHGSFVNSDLVADRWEEVLDEYEEKMGEEEWQIGADMDKLDGPAGLYGHVKGKTAADGLRVVQVRKGFEEIGDLHML